MYLSFQLIYPAFDFSITGVFLTISKQNAVILRSTNNNCIRKFLIVFISIVKPPLMFYYIVKVFKKRSFFAQK